MVDSVSSCPPPATAIVEVESRCHGGCRGSSLPHRSKTFWYSSHREGSTAYTATFSVWCPTDVTDTEGRFADGSVVVSDRGKAISAGVASPTPNDSVCGVP